MMKTHENASSLTGRVPYGLIAHMQPEHGVGMRKKQSKLTAQKVHHLIITHTLARYVNFRETVHPLCRKRSIALVCVCVLFLGC